MFVCVARALCAGKLFENRKTVYQFHRNHDLGPKYFVTRGRYLLAEATTFDEKHPSSVSRLLTDLYFMKRAAVGRSLTHTPSTAEVKHTARFPSLRFCFEVIGLLCLKCVSKLILYTKRQM
jgi:hypothetical protein